MKLSAADIYTYYKPSRCRRRVHLLHNPPDDQHSETSGQYYANAQEADFHVERYYFKRLDQPFDISKFPEAEQALATHEAIQRQEPVIFRPVLQSKWRKHGKTIHLEASPQFLLWREDSYAMLHCRMAKKITRENHPDLIYTAQFNAWMYERIYGEWPRDLEVGNSTGSMSDLPFPEQGSIEQLLQNLLQWRQSKALPYHPVSWTKCQNCLFKDYCWELAEACEDIALIPNLESGLILDLKESGLNTVSDLLKQHDNDSLARFEWGEAPYIHKVGHKKARKMLLTAEAMIENEPRLLQDPKLPQTDHWMMFDLEGVPARPGQPERVYLWGMFLKGLEDQNMQQMAQTLNRKADRENWFAFLERAGDVLNQYGDMPFIHWGSFESYCIKMYIKRYGDRHGIGKRIQHNLLDFFEVLKKTVIIPLPSYSLKVIEKYVGFERPDEDTGGYWSVVNYLKSLSTKNDARRAEIMQQLRDYNCADLEAMWHVVVWYQDLLKKLA